MHRFAISLAGSCLITALATLTMPGMAQADEYRAEAHATAEFDNGEAHGAIGVAGGRDFSLVPGAFVGVEASADKLLVAHTRAALGIAGRAGLNLGGLGKIYAVAGYSTAYLHGANGDWDFGAGVQHSFLPFIYGKLEYRHYTVSSHGLNPARDAVTLGIGAHF